MDKVQGYQFITVDIVGPNFLYLNRNIPPHRKRIFLRPPVEAENMGTEGHLTAGIWSHIVDNMQVRPMLSIFLTEDPLKFNLNFKRSFYGFFCTLPIT